MRIAVMGAGAVGCYYGGMLSRAGHQVILIGRTRHVEAIHQHGLFMDTTRFRAHVPVRASTEVSDIQGASLVLCCIKSNDTEHAAAMMAPFVGPDAIVLSLQNGVDNAGRLHARKRRPGIVRQLLEYLVAVQVHNRELASDVDPAAGRGPGEATAGG